MKLNNNNSISEKERVSKFLKKNSIIDIICNSGAIKAKVIGFNRKNFKNTVVVSLTKVITGKIEKGSIYQCLITTLKAPLLVAGIGVFRSNRNTGILIHKVGKNWIPVGTAVLGSVSCLQVLNIDKLGNQVIGITQKGVF